MVTYVPLSTNPRGATIIAVLWTMMTLSLTFLSLRIYSKLVRARRFWLDDYFIIASWILLLVSCASSTANARIGFGLPIFQVPPENFLPFGIQSNISGFASIIAVAWSKTSFGITLLRLSDGWMKWFIIVLLVLLNITHYLSGIFFWVSCNPPAKTWNVMLPGECWPTYTTVNYSLFVGAYSTFCDFALALLPWRLLLRFNMYNREKIGVAVAMSMGIFAGIACIVKMTTIPQVLYGDDFSYDSLPLVVWGFVEPSLTIMAASIPMMRHLFKAFRRDTDDDSFQPRGPSANTAATTMTTGNNSVGGGRENRRAAERANVNHRAEMEGASASVAGGGRGLMGFFGRGQGREVNAAELEGGRRGGGKEGRGKGSGESLGDKRVGV